jgi:photosystem II stability/assembly factor-like uncharacterized protein
MVKHTLCAVVAATAISCAQRTAAAQTVSAAELRQNLFASCFISDQEGWVVGDLGRTFHTADGAKTWERQGAGARRVAVSIACPDRDHLWAAGQAGQIWHSDDGGNTWLPQQSGTRWQLLSIAFANVQRGWAVGDFGRLLRTEDGGQTWTRIALPRDLKLPPDVAEVVDPGDVVLNSIAFADPDHVWIAGEFGVILASTDGGLTWKSQDSPVQSTLFGIFFADQQRGWAVGLESTLLRTTDGGKTWRKQEIETPWGFPLALYDIAVRGPYGWAVGNSGLLLSSNDGGETWRLVKVPVEMSSAWLRGLSLLPQGRGYIVGASGLVLATDRDKYTPLKERF